MKAKSILLAVFLMCFTSLMANNVFFEETNDSTHKQNITSFLVEFEKGNFSKALEYIPLIEASADSLYDVAIKISDCYYFLDKDKECIEFTLEAIKNHPSFNFYYYPRVANCYYFQKEYNLAKKYFELYIEEINKENFLPSLYDYGRYALTLHKLYDYAKAEIYFAKSIELLLAEENLSLEEIHKTEHKDFLKLILREYAYNFIFQGKETEGLKMLNLASNCGDEASIEMYNILITSSTFGKDVHVKKKYIRKFDEIITSYSNLKNLPNIPADFWGKCQELNVEFNELNVALHKKKQPKTLRKAINNIASSKQYLERYLYELSPHPVSDIESNLTYNLSGNGDLFKELRIYPANEPNAFATPHGQIYLTQGLFYRYHFKENLLLGVCAHELAHYLLAHSLVSEWKQQKKERNNKIWAGVAVGLNTAAHAVSSYYSASAGVGANDENYWSDYWGNVGTINNNLIYAFQKDAYYFRFKYSRIQEIEADIAAYRYCEAMGIGGYSYILALELLGNGSGYMNAEKTSDHPTNSYRINLLKYLHAKENTSTSSND